MNTIIIAILLLSLALIPFGIGVIRDIKASMRDLKQKHDVREKLRDQKKAEIPT